MVLNAFVRRTLAAVAVAAVALMLSAGAVLAHEHREVGEYELTVGFSIEPALVNEPNGLELRVQQGHGDSGTPVEGLTDTVEAEIQYGDQTMPLEIRPQFGEPGAYTADIFPTEPGAYTFRIWGSINGTDFDETFTSGPETFSEVAAVSAIAFPGGAEGSGEAGTTVADVEDTADSARTLAIVGIVVGALGLFAGAAGVMMAANARSRAGSPRNATAAGRPAD